MLIFIDPNGNYPRFSGDIVLENPSWEIGNPLPEGWIPVQSTTPPEPSASQVLDEHFPVLVGGVYNQKWVLREKTEQELSLDLASQTAREKLKNLGLTDVEIDSLARGLR